MATVSSSQADVSIVSSDEGLTVETSAEEIFTVADLNKIKPWLKSQSVNSKSLPQFKCSLNGFPIPEILWTKDGLILGNNNILTTNQVSYGNPGQ